LDIHNPNPVAPTRRAADAGQGECFGIALVLFGFNAGCDFEAVGRTNELMIRISFPEKTIRNSREALHSVFAGV
tara:strand:+ start:606 stop:827 length:222 start_codon:yes stop_codon:yes gene_type:complete